MHKAPYDNQNRAIVDRADPVTPLVYFNIVIWSRRPGHSRLRQRLL